MTIEFVGADALEDLFDIIAGHYVSQEEIEKRDKDLASSISVGFALTAAALLKVAEAIKSVKGGEGGDEVDENIIATDSEVNDVIGKYFDISTDTTITPSTAFIDNAEIATDDEINEIVNKYFNNGGK